MNNQTCGTCEETKSLEEFDRDKSKKSGRHTKCKLCSAFYKKQTKVKERRNFLRRLKYQQDCEHREQIKATVRLRMQDSQAKELQKAAHCRRYQDSEYKERMIAKSKKWRVENRERYNTYARNKYKKDIAYRLKNVLRSRVGHAIRKEQKVGSAIQDLGCSIAAFRLYIENQFEEGMSWDNWGRDGWHLDHVLPLASFDLTNRMEFLEAANWLNYQPLWAADNIAKGAKIS